MNSAKANYGSSEFYNAARALDRGEINLDTIEYKLEERLYYTINEDMTIRYSDFYNLLFKKFKDGSGFYGWAGLRYFLYEYELNLLEKSRQKKVDWNDLLKTEKDKISIEHIYPQTETEEWASSFVDVDKINRRYFNATLGNLLLLSMSINSAFQNDSFADKKQAKYDNDGKKIRNGYADGSHSEIEVAALDQWGPVQIYTRGLQLLAFMEKRWDFQFKNDDERKKLLFLNFEEESS